MLQEGLECLAALVKQGQSGVVPAPNYEPRHVYYVRQGDGTLERKEASAPYFQAKVFNVASLVDAFGMVSGPHAFWYSRDGIYLVGDHGRDWVNMPVKLSAQAEWLKTVGDKQYEYSQKDLINVLKTLLVDNGGQELLNLVRAVKFRVLQEGEAEIRQGKASLGRKIEAELAGVAPIPDFVSFEIPAFVNVGMSSAKRYKVGFSVTVDPQAERFILKPLPNTYETFMLQAEDDMLGHLLGCIKASQDAMPSDELANAPVLFGSPTLVK